MSNQHMEIESNQEPLLAQQSEPQQLRNVPSWQQLATLAHNGIPRLSNEKVDATKRNREINGTPVKYAFDAATGQTMVAAAASTSKAASKTTRQSKQSIREQQQPSQLEQVNQSPDKSKNETEEVHDGSSGSGTKEMAATTSAQRGKESGKQTTSETNNAAASGAKNEPSEPPNDDQALFDETSTCESIERAALKSAQQEKESSKQTKSKEKISPANRAKNKSSEQPNTNSDQDFAANGAKNESSEQPNASVRDLFVETAIREMVERAASESAQQGTESGKQTKSHKKNIAASRAKNESREQLNTGDQDLGDETTIRETIERARRENRLSKDGCITPKNPPVIKADGTFAQPRGPARSGFYWNETTAKWTPQPETIPLLAKVDAASYVHLKRKYPANVATASKHNALLVGEGKADRGSNANVLKNIPDNDTFDSAKARQVIRQLKRNHRRRKDGRIVPKGQLTKLPNGTFARPELILAGFCWDEVKGHWEAKPNTLEVLRIEYDKMAGNSSGVKRQRPATDTLATNLSTPPKALHTHASSKRKALFSQAAGVESSDDELSAEHSNEQETSERAFVTDQYIEKVEKNIQMAISTNRLLADGCVVPKSSPRRRDDGGYGRPKGRSLLGFEWDDDKGVWQPDSTTIHLLDSRLTTSQKKNMKRDRLVVVPSHGKPRSGLEATLTAASESSDDDNDKIVAKRKRGRPKIRHDDKHDAKRSRVSTNDVGVLGEAGHGTSRNQIVANFSLSPKKPPALSSDGTFVRPKGRAPEGRQWNEYTGLWEFSGAVKLSKTTSGQTQSLNNIFVRPPADEAAIRVKKSPGRPKKQAALVQPGMHGMHKANRALILSTTDVVPMKLEESTKKRAIRERSVFDADADRANIRSMRGGAKSAAKKASAILAQTSSRKRLPEQIRLRHRYFACELCTGCTMKENCGTCLPCMLRMSGDEPGSKCCKRICTEPVLGRVELPELRAEDQEEEIRSVTMSLSDASEFVD
ncbi:hypothetical protein MPSEU_000929600 [Mayamaea pseudoterrestris]|nr:hypothetical protein MPSEU_000929600 [Mayamaea pseudoterrestris]